MEDTRIGVIDSLSTGLSLVTERVWVVAIPVLLDLWYWLGPQLSISPLLKRVERFFVQSAPEAISGTPITIDMVTDMLTTLGQQFNLFSLLSASLLGVPTLMAAGNSENASVIEVHGWLVLISLAAFLILVGLAIGCIYFTFIVRGLVGQSEDHLALLRQAGVMWLRVVALVLLVLFFVVALIVPFSFLVGFLALVSGGAATFLIWLFYISVIWIGIYLYFTVDAIVINDVGPIRAIWNSANVVVRNFWSALALVVLIFVLKQGLALVWQRLGEVHPVGTIVGIAGHAFVGSGLVAAGLLFYRDRYRYWQEQRLEAHG